MLAACHDPNSLLSRKLVGFVWGPSKNEYLNLVPLGLAWTETWTEATHIPEVMFDLTLPREDESTSPITSTRAFQKVY